jgi:hypothetical protein
MYLDTFEFPGTKINETNIAMDPVGATWHLFGRNRVSGFFYTITGDQKFRGSGVVNA